MNDKITIDRSLLQQVLDALVSETSPEWECNSYHPKVYPAMTALREALAAPATITPIELADRITAGEQWAVQPADMPKLGCVNHDCDKCKAAVQQSAEHWPTNAEQVRQFVGSNFCSLKYALRKKTPDENDIYEMSAHDLISAFNDWRDFVLKQEAKPAQPAEPVAWIDAVMEQAQYFASAWSFVGGPFDDGTGLDAAEAEKNGLRAMLTAPPAQREPLTDEQMNANLREQNTTLDAKLAEIEATEREECALIAEAGFRFAKDGYQIADDIRDRSKP